MTSTDVTVFILSEAASTTDDQEQLELLQAAEIWQRISADEPTVQPVKRRAAYPRRFLWPIIA